MSSRQRLPALSGKASLGRSRKNVETAAGNPLTFRIGDYFIASSLAAISLLAYLFTMSRSISYIDGGELTTVLWTLGIPHPTGYPLFTLIGYAFVHIPILTDVAERANLFAAVCTAASGGIFYFVFLRAQLCLGGKIAPGRDEKQRQTIKVASTTRKDPERDMRLASIIAGISLIFSSTFWDQSTSIEVYPLQLVLFASILVVWLGFYLSPTRWRAFFSGLVLGLGFTNHMTTLLTVPALVFLAILSYRRRKYKPSLIYFMVLGGALAGLLYLYLPIRASQQPIQNWGDPETLKRFVWHVTGKQFRTWMFSSLDVFEHQLGVFFSSLYLEFRVTLIIIILGIGISIASHRNYFWWSLILLVSDLLYAANYSIHDIASYFLLGYVSLILFGTIGFRYVIEKLDGILQSRKIHFNRNVAITVPLLVFPAFSAVTNFSGVNESKDYAVEMYARDILTPLPPKSVVLSYQWDDFVSASLYYQHVDHLREDVVVIDKELLRRSWYAEQVHRRYAYLFPAFDPVYTVYQDNLRLFENDLHFDANTIEHSYSNFIREIIYGAIRDGRDVFVGPEIEDEYLYGFNKVPYGLLFELRSDTNYVPCDTSGLNGFYAAKQVHNDYSAQIRSFYSRMFLARAGYEYAHRNLKLTSKWLDKALEVDPSSQAAQTAKLQVLQQLRAE